MFSLAMYKFSGLHAFVLLHTFGEIILFDNSFINALFPTDLPTSGEPFLSSIVPTVKPVVLPSPAVPPCEDCEASFKDIFNAVQNTRLFKTQKTEMPISACDNKVLLPLLGAPKDKEFNHYDYSYVVFILAIKDGKMSTVCQGIRLSDRSILTIYGCTQIGEGLWVQYFDGQIVNVTCMAEPKGCNTDFLADQLYTVKLIVEPICDHFFLNEPEVETYSSACTKYQGIIPGYLIVREKANNCSDQGCAISRKPGILINDETNVAVSLLIIGEPDTMCPYQGAVFVSDKSDAIHGMAIYKPPVALNIKSASPATKSLLATTSCIIPLIHISV